MGLPITNSSFSNLIEEIKLLPYKIYSIAFINFNEINIKYIMKYKENNNILYTFLVKADIQNDIYNLYYIDNNKEIFYNIAYIPDYKCSVFMNSMFRNIKENINLDSLEESDNEDEFENTNLDKYVDTEKSIRFDCSFNQKFKMWVPIKISDKNIVTKDKLLTFPKK